MTAVTIHKLQGMREPTIELKLDRGGHIIQQRLTKDDWDRLAALVAIAFKADVCSLTVEVS